MTNSSLPTDASIPPSSPPFEYCDLKRAGLTSGPIPDQGPQALAAIWALIGAATVFVALRFYCKVSRHKGLWWDDCFMGISWVCFLVQGVICHRVISHGFGRYPCDIEPQNFRVINLEGNNLGAMFTLLATMWSKTAFAVVLLRLAPAGGKVRMGVWCIIGSLNLLLGLQVILVWVKCIPASRAWDPTVPGSCWDIRYINRVGVFSSCFSGVCDLVLSLLPWSLIWNLRMSRKEKLGVGLAMSMGIL